VRSRSSGGSIGVSFDLNISSYSTFLDLPCSELAVNQDDHREIGEGNEKKRTYTRSSICSSKSDICASISLCMVRIVLYNLANPLTRDRSAIFCLRLHRQFHILG